MRRSRHAFLLVAIGAIFSGALAIGVARAAGGEQVGADARARLSPQAVTPVPPVGVTFQRRVRGPDVGVSRIGPGGLLQMEVAAIPDAEALNASLTDFVPDGFTIVDPSGGGVTAAAGGELITWPLGTAPAGVAQGRIYTLRSPLALNPPASYSFRAGFLYEGGSAAGSPASYLVASGVLDSHYRLGENRPPDAMTWLANVDAPAEGITNHQRFHVRFQVRNPDTAEVQWSPQVEWAISPDGPFQRVMPDSEQYQGQPFVVQAVDTITDGQQIPVASFALGSASATPVAGVAFDEHNPGVVPPLPAGAYTEVEFSLRSTVWVSWTTSYYIRLTDGGQALTGGVMATVVTEAKPAPVLTQPSSEGIPVTQPTPAPGSQPLGPLALAPTPGTSPHNGYTLATDKCAACHRTHTGSGPNGNGQPMPASNLCFTCHDAAGTGSNYKVQSQYTDPLVTPNDPTTGAFYSHPATSLTPTGHIDAAADEFGGVLNRHSECTDCHNPHQANDGGPTPTSGGWQVSGALQGISGVNVSNSLTPGATPTYVWTTAVAYGYELCFKCHSGYTQLLTYPNDTAKKWDKGAEFNPNNGSTHAIEGPGRNDTTPMANNLLGSSPFKLWQFQVTDTLRCENCHGNYRLATTPGPSVTPPAASARLDVHTSRYQGILMNNYRWQTLKPAGEDYSASDFALCYQCHAEAPYTDVSGDRRSDTNFRFHGYHVFNIKGVGSGGTDIATPGAGQGNALCAECHYRPHSTTYAYQPDQANGPRGVNFAPDVLDVNGTPPAVAITPGAGATPDTGTCTLTCHGKQHNPETW